VSATRRDDLLVGLAVLVPLGFYLVREHAIAGASGFPLDDSWIHLQFARNVVEGAGFSFNPGHPVAGSTAPLWTLLLAAAGLVAGTSPAAAKAIGVATTICAALLTRRAALAWGASPPAAVMAGIGLAWAGPIAWGALSGMEVSLAALLVSAALLAHARGRTFPTAVLVAAAALARPEALILVPLVALAARDPLRRVAAFALVTAVVVAPAVGFSLATAGTPLPVTAAAKIEGGLIGWLGGVRESAFDTWIGRPLAFAHAWVAWLAGTHWLLPAALLLAIPVVWRRAGLALALPALALVLHPVAMALLAPYRDPSFQEGRYSMHLLPLALVVVAVALPGVRWIAHAGVFVWLAAALAMLPAAANRYAWGVQNINGMQVHLGHWVDRHLPRDARLALNDIGAIAYISRREVVDLMGLVTPEILPYRRRGEAGVIEYVRQTCPEYVIVFPTWFPELTHRDEMLEPVYRVRLEHNLVSGASEMVVYRLRRCTV
jgi:hypothetical protein